jgi:cytoskeletal protein CcmA (bactofilin family)
MWGKSNVGVPLAAAPKPKNVVTNTGGSDPLGPSVETEYRTRGWLGSSLRVKGEISGTEDLLIDGEIEGLIQLDERKLTVGAAAKLTADINARDVVVYGYVKGNVHAAGKIEIKKGGSVNGNLTTAQILIEDGADFRGSIEIDRGAEKVAEKNVSSRTAAAAGSR